MDETKTAVISVHDEWMKEFMERLGEYNYANYAETRAAIAWLLAQSMSYPISPRAKGMFKEMVKLLNWLEEREQL
jgi:hypothetical protein